MGPIVFDAGHLEHDDNDDYSDQVSPSLFVESKTHIDFTNFLKIG
jgi:hypothetical protein